MSDYLVILSMLVLLTVLVSYVAFAGRMVGNPVVLLLPIATVAIVLFTSFADAQGSNLFPLGLAIVGLVFLMAVIFIISLFLPYGQARSDSKGNNSEEPPTEEVEV